MNMKLINYEKYWLLVAIDIPPMQNDWTWNEHARDSTKSSPIERSSLNAQINWANNMSYNNGKTFLRDNLHKIIYHLPKDNAPILEGVPLLPELPKQEEDVEQLADKFMDSKNGEGWRNLMDSDLDNLREVWIEGYKAASKNKWSDELINFVKKVRDDFQNVSEEYQKEAENLLQSLSPVTLPIDFKPEYENEYEGNSGYFSSDEIVGKHLKTVKNEAGIEVLQGEWIYQQ